MVEVPFFKPSIGEAEIDEVVQCLRSGWLTTGPRSKRFEEEFASFLGVSNAVALNSCTAALHLALEAIGLGRGDWVLVPTLTFAATAEVVRYFDATPVFVDSEAETLCMDPVAAEKTLARIAAGKALPRLGEAKGRVRAIIPVHYGGQIADVGAFRRLADKYQLYLIEDAAHTLPAYFRNSSTDRWCSVGTSADITCFSFYANKCITTGEGGMAVTSDPKLAERMRIMSLHGLSQDAWKRFEKGGRWYYEVVAPGFKYNLTDIAASLGIHQLARVNQLWEGRRRVAQRLLAGLEDESVLILPKELPDRQHSWHLFAIRLRLAALKIDRAGFIRELNERGVGASVHWMPLHLQPYYREVYGYESKDFPIAAELWPELVSLPIYPDMSDEQCDRVVAVVRQILREQRL